MLHVDQGRLHAFLDGELDDAEALQVEEHLAGCGACTTLLEEAARVHAVSAELVAEVGLAAGAPDWKELVARAAQRPGAGNPAAEMRPSPRPWPGRLLLPGLAWAATLVLAFTIGWQASQSGDLAGQRLERTPDAADLNEGATGRAAVGVEGPAALGAASELRQELPGGQLPAGEPAPESAGMEALPLSRPPMAGPRPQGPAPEPARANAVGAVTEAEQAVAASAPPGQDPPPGERAQLPPAPAAAPVPAVTEAQVQRKASFRTLDVPAEERFTVADALEAGFEPIEPGAGAERLGVPHLSLPAAAIRAAAIGPGTALAGGDPDRVVLRLVLDPGNGAAAVVLLQQYTGAIELDLADDKREDRDAAGRGQPSVPRATPEHALRAGADEPAPQLLDAVLTVEPSGQRRLTWRDPRGYLVVLIADLPEDDLLRLARSLR